MKVKARPKQKSKKDFEKLTRKVGARKSSRNETHVNGVSSKRVVMPVQQLESSDSVAEYLTGLRHYNEKKRLDAINALIRTGAGRIQHDRLGEVIVSLGFGLSDEDEAVRKKCGSFLCVILKDLDGTLLGPFYPKICIQIRAALADVSAPIRLDTIEFLKTVVDLAIFDSSEVTALIKSLVEVNSTLLITQTMRASKKGQPLDIRYAVYECSEALLGQIALRRQKIEEGFIDPSQWTISALLQRTFSPPSTLDQDVRKLIQSLELQGEDVAKKRIEKMSIDAGIFEKPSVVQAAAAADTKPAKKEYSSGSAFSKLSLLMRDNSDSD